MNLSERIRPGVEAAPWVIHEIMELETAMTIIQERHSASLEALKLAAQINPFGSVENAAARDAARAMMPTARVPEVPTEPTPPTYSYSTDDELYRGEFDSPDAAAAEAFYDDPELEAVSVGENRKHTAHFYVSADRILEDVTERAYDECGGGFRGLARRGDAQRRQEGRARETRRRLAAGAGVAELLACCKYAPDHSRGDGRRWQTG